MVKKFWWRAQATLEYVFLIGLVAAAVAAMLVYISRGFQGNLRVQADQMGEQYSPKNMDTNIIQVSHVSLNDNIRETAAGEISTNITVTNMNNQGKENVVKPLKQESY